MYETDQIICAQTILSVLTEENYGEPFFRIILVESEIRMGIS